MVCFAHTSPRLSYNPYQMGRNNPTPLGKKLAEKYCKPFDIGYK